MKRLLCALPAALLLAGSALAGGVPTATPRDLREGAGRYFGASIGVQCLEADGSYLWRLEVDMPWSGGFFDEPSELAFEAIYEGERAEARLRDILTDVEPRELRYCIDGALLGTPSKDAEPLLSIADGLPVYLVERVGDYFLVEDYAGTAGGYVRAALLTEWNSRDDDWPSFFREYVAPDGFDWTFAGGADGPR